MQNIFHNIKIAKYFSVILVSLFSILMASSASAAVIYIFPDKGNFDLKQDVIVDIKINSEGEAINAAQATISWPSSNLEFVEFKKDNSAFNFWVQDPILESDGRSLSFIGGTPKGISGNALQVLRIRFKASGAGSAAITFSNTAITASDGKGTNVLSVSKGATFSIGSQAVVQPETPTEVPQPVVVQRPPVIAKNLPQVPEITVPLYPDSEKWYNYLGQAVALWKVPDDVVSMAVKFDQNPNSVPQTAEKELATGKKLGTLEEGVWYIHVRFRNNIGWGPTDHYRIAVDTTPPTAFEVTTNEGETTDNPAPILKFKSSDALSDIAEYQIKIDDQEIIRINPDGFDSSFTLPLQPPGIRNIIVKAQDRAENSVSDNITLEILPISSPSITFITKEIFSDEEQGLTIKGTALPSINIILEVYQLQKNGTRGEVADKSTTLTDEIGNWEFTFDKSFRNGQYIIAVKAQDKRGALSLEVESSKVNIKSRPIIQIGFIQLGKGGAALFLLFLLIAGFGGGIWFYKIRQGKLNLRVSFAESEITKIFQLLKSDVNELKKSIQTPTPSDDEYSFKRIEENFKKMESYIKKGVGKINK